MSYSVRASRSSFQPLVTRCRFCVSQCRARRLLVTAPGVLVISLDQDQDVQAYSNLDEVVIPEVCLASNVSKAHLSQVRAPYRAFAVANYSHLHQQWDCHVRHGSSWLRLKDGNQPQATDVTDALVNACLIFCVAKVVIY